MFYTHTGHKQICLLYKGSCDHQGSILLTQSLIELDYYQDDEQKTARASGQKSPRVSTTHDCISAVKIKIGVCMC